MAEVNLKELLSTYETKNLTIATVCSHSSLQIFHGAKKEGFKTLGISVGEIKKFYDAFPLGKPDDFFIVDNYKDIAKYAEELREKKHHCYTSRVVCRIPRSKEFSQPSSTHFWESPCADVGV